MNKDGNREQADVGRRGDNEVSPPRDASIINVSCWWSRRRSERERGTGEK